jgi:hypothetical protein
MKNLNPRIERLKQMMVLEEKRAALQGELDSIMQKMSILRDQLLDETESVAITPPTGLSIRRNPVVRRQKRGLLKDKVMAALEAAGTAGVIVKDLAAAIGTKPVNVHSWFHSALKRNAPIEKIRGGHYRLEVNGGAPIPKLAATPANAPDGKAIARRGGAKRGQLTAQILDALQEAGSGGITVADLSAKLGTKYKNVYIWFATTGKKNSSVKKVGPAKYKLANRTAEQTQI